MKRTLRVFISNTAHDQEWQKAEDEKAKQDQGTDDATAAQPPAQPPTTTTVDMDNGKNIPGWVLRVEGRVLDVSD